VKRRRVLVLADDSLLIAGILSILRERPEIEVATVRRVGSDLHRRVREIGPHVVVMERGAIDKDGGVSLARFLREHARTTVVALRVDRPDMVVFRARRVRQATWEQLVSIVNGVQGKTERVAASRKAAERHLAP